MLCFLSSGCAVPFPLPHSLQALTVECIYLVMVVVIMVSSLVHLSYRTSCYVVLPALLQAGSQAPGLGVALLQCARQLGAAHLCLPFHTLGFVLFVVVACIRSITRSWFELICILLFAPAGSLVESPPMRCWCGRMFFLMSQLGCAIAYSRSASQALMRS